MPFLLHRRTVLKVSLSTLLVLIGCSLSFDANRFWALVAPSPPVSPARRNLHSILSGIGAYREDHHGYLPQDDRGADHALYKLKPYVDVRCFADPAAPGLRGPPMYDDNSQVVTNCAWDYLNVSSPFDIEANQVLLSSKVANKWGEFLVAFRLEYVRALRVPARCGRRLIGCYVSDEGMVVADNSTYHEWLRLGPTGDGWMTASAADGSWMVTTHDSSDKRYEFRLRESEWARRTIRCKGHEFHENAIFDEFGRMTRIERSPDDWRDIWDKMCN